MLSQTMIYLLVLLIVVVTAATVFRAYQIRLEGFNASNSAYNEGETAYKDELAIVQALQEDRYNGRRDFNDMLATVDVPPEQQCLVNFYSLGCRFTGYLGPFKSGFFDSNNAVLAALKMGCRTLILEIDYYGDVCLNPYPRLVVRDVDKANVSNPKSDIQCQSKSQSNIADVASAIAQYAFSNSVPNPADPLIVVLYILSIPHGDGSQDPNTVKTTFFSNIAESLKPLLPYAVNSLAAGGNYSRQAQESKLMTNPISTYSGQVLFFCNADTSVFRTQKGIPSNLDLDYLVNLRLCYNMKPIEPKDKDGKNVTQSTSTNSNGTKWGILDSVEEYMQIPNDRITPIQTTTNSMWTVLFDRDPGVVVPKESVDQVMDKIGVHCVPIQIWNSGYNYMFDKKYFGVHSWIPKPPKLRYTIPSTAIPAPAAKQTDSNGGSLRSPTTS